MTEVGKWARMADDRLCMVVAMIGTLARVEVDNVTHVVRTTTLQDVTPVEVSREWAHEYVQTSKRYGANVELMTMSAAHIGLTGEHLLLTAGEVMTAITASVAWQNLETNARDIAQMFDIAGDAPFMAEHAPTAYDADNLMTVEWVNEYSAALGRRADALAYMSNLLDANDDDSQDRADACTIIESLIGRSL